MAHHVIRPMKVSEVAAKLGLPYHRALRLLRGLNVQLQGAVLVNRSEGQRANRWVVPGAVVQHLTGKSPRPPVRPKNVIHITLLCEGDGHWVAEVPELKLSAVGPTEDAACQRVKARAMVALGQQMAQGSIDLDCLTFRASA